MRRKKGSAAACILAWVALAAMAPAESARAQVYELPARAVRIDDISACESEACFGAYRNTSYPVAIAVIAKVMAFQETSLQARRTGSGKAFETVAKNTAGAPSGGAVLWHVRPSLLNLGPQIDVRIRIVSKNKGAKNCPTLKLRAIERPPWVESYDPSASAWTETDFESVTAIRVAAPLLPKSEFVCK